MFYVGDKLTSLTVILFVTGGAHWSDLFTRPSSEHNFSLAVVFGSFILQCFIFGTIAWYLDAVWPGPYGIPETALFFLKVKSHVK